MRQTYRADGGRVDEFSRLLDPRDRVEPMRMPTTSGRVVKTRFLLYVGDRLFIEVIASRTTCTVG